MQPLYVRVKNWDRFQHYKSRENAPSWIKVKPDLLIDYEFQKLTEAERYRLIGIWLLAGKLHNRVPFDAKFVAKSIDVKKVDLAKFVHTGWLELIDEDGTPVSIESLDTVYIASSDSLALAEQSRKAGDKGRRADGDSGEPAAVVYTLPASAEIEFEVEKLLRLNGCDEKTPAILAGYASQLPLAIVARIRARAEELGKGVGWAINGMKDEIAERSAA